MIEPLSPSSEFDDIAVGDQVILNNSYHWDQRLLTVSKVTKTQFTAYDNKGEVRFLKNGKIYGTSSDIWQPRSPGYATPASPEAIANFEAWKHFSVGLAEYKQGLAVMCKLKDQLLGVCSPQEVSKVVEKLDEINANLQPVISLITRSQSNASS